MLELYVRIFSISITTIKILSIAFLVAMTAWSCSSSTSADTDDWSPSDQPYASAKMISVASDSLFDLAQQIPGFGGVFINDSDQLSIYLTDPAGQKEQAADVFSGSEFNENGDYCFDKQGYFSSCIGYGIFQGQVAFYGI